MSKDIVWVSKAPSDTTLTKGFVPDVFLEDEKLALDAMERSRLGEPLPADRFPKEFYGQYHQKTYKNQPDIFLGGGFWCVSKASAEVLQKHDLGKTRLYPTSFFQNDRERPVEGTYFCLALGEQKTAFLPEQSAGKVKPGYGLTYWELSPTLEDDQVTVSKDALTKPEVWIDSQIPRAIFFSDALVQSLHAANLSRRWRFRRCTVQSKI